MENLNIDFNHWKGSQIGDTIQANLSEQRDLQIISALKPEFSKDGNTWCYLYGVLPNDCIVGFGETPREAMFDFVRNFDNQKAIVFNK